MHQALATSPEWQLLLRACAAAGRTGADGGCDRNRDASIDWERLIRIATQHDIGPRLYDSIRSNPLPDAAARTAVAVVESQYYATGLRNALLDQELHRLLADWQSAGVPAIVLKGAALTATAYRNRALRPMRDLDVLVHRSDMPVVKDLLARAGYEIDPNQRDRIQWYDRHHYHLAFEKPGASERRVRCEVHWQLERPGRRFAIDTEGLWARAVSVRSGQHDIAVLSPEDTLLHLSLHVCKHRLAGGFRGFCDIAAVIAASGPCFVWEQACRRAEDWEIADLIYVPLVVTARLLHAPVPSGVITRLARGADDERLIGAATDEALADRVSAALFPELFALCYGASVAERTRTVRRVLTRSARPPVGVRAGWSYYPGRLGHVVRTYGAQLWRFSQQRQQAMAEADRQKRLAAWLTPFDDNHVAAAESSTG